MNPILVVSHWYDSRKHDCMSLTRAGYPCYGVDSAHRARWLLSRKKFSLVVMDDYVRWDGDDDLLNHIVTKYPNTGVLSGGYWGRPVRRQSMHRDLLGSGPLNSYDSEMMLSVVMRTLGDDPSRRFFLPPVNADRLTALWRRLSKEKRRKDKRADQRRSTFMATGQLPGKRRVSKQGGWPTKAASVSCTQMPPHRPWFDRD